MARHSSRPARPAGAATRLTEADIVTGRVTTGCSANVEEVNQCQAQHDQYSK